MPSKLHLKAQRLRPLLDALVLQVEQEKRVESDPVEFPRRYSLPRDVEVVALLSASLAYGRVDLFRPKIAQLLLAMGPSPAEFLRGLTLSQAQKLLDGFVYRFNVPSDMAVLLLGVGEILRLYGSLEALFLQGLAQGKLKQALSFFTHSIQSAAPVEDIIALMGPLRGMAHLLPSSNGAGASKRLLLFLRWMVRGPDTVDLGLWKHVSPAVLMMPVDTHVAKVARHLGLTSRKAESWKMSEDITNFLRLVDPNDPIRYDFALCHLGMSGMCPTKTRRENCQDCPLQGECKTGRRVVVG